MLTHASRRIGVKRVTAVAVVMVVLPLALRAGAGVDQELRGRLLAMRRADQEVRERVVALLKKLPDANADSEDFQELVAEQERVDEANLRELDRIVAEHGWPGAGLVGEDASDAAWLIVQHSSLDQQQRYLPVLQAAAARGRTSAANVAMLEDRIRVGKGEQQVYGTQIVTGPDGKLVVSPIEDPAHVDARRAAVGLPPMEEYLKQCESSFGTPIGRGNLDSE